MRKSVQRLLVSRSNTAEEEVSRRSPPRPAFASSSHHLAGTEQGSPGPGRDLAFVMQTLNVLSDRSVPDYVAILCCALCSRVGAGQSDNVHKAHCLIHSFLPALIPPHPGLSSFMANNDVAMVDGDQKLVAVPAASCVARIDGVVDKFIMQEAAAATLCDRPCPLSLCEIQMRSYVAPGPEAWWLYDIGGSPPDPQWVYLATHQPPGLLERLQLVAAPSPEDFDPRVLRRMILSMHQGEIARFKLTAHQTLVFEIKLLRMKVLITSACNLFTQELSLDRFFGPNIYSNFSRVEPPYYAVEWSLDDCTSRYQAVTRQPLLVQQPSTPHVTIRRRTARQPEPALYETIDKLSEEWRWAVSVSPADVEVRFLAVDSRGHQADSYFIWSVDARDYREHQAESPTAPALLRKLLKLSVCAIKMQIAVIAQIALHGLLRRRDQVGKPKDLQTLLLQVVVTGGQCLLDKAAAINSGQDTENEFVVPTQREETELVVGEVSAEAPEALCERYLDIPLAGNILFTTNLAGAAAGYGLDHFFKGPLRLLQLEDIDRGSAVFDGVYHKTRTSAGCLYTIALVSAFRAWSSYSTPLLELGVDDVFIGFSPVVLRPHRSAPRAMPKCKLKSAFLDIASLSVKEPDLELNITYARNCFAKAVTSPHFPKIDPTIKWPSLCIHYISNIAEARSNQSIQLTPTRLKRSPLYQWLGDYAKSVLYESISMSNEAVVVPDVFGVPTFVLPMCAVLKDAGPAYVNRGYRGETTIGECRIREALSGLLAPSVLRPNTSEHLALTRASRAARSSALSKTALTAQPALYYVLSRVEDIADAGARVDKVLQLTGLNGLWPFQYPQDVLSAFLENSSREAHVDALIAIWSYLVITAKFGKPKSTRVLSKWSVGVIPANVDAQMKSSLEERGSSAMKSSVSRSNVGAKQVCDLADYDHLLIEKSRHEVADMLVALHLLYAESQTGDPTLILLLNESDNAEARIARILAQGFLSFCAPYLAEIMRRFEIAPSYELSILDRCRQLVEGIAALAATSRRLKVLAYAALFSADAVAVSGATWRELPKLGISLRSPEGAVQSDLRVGLELAQLHHEVFRAQLRIDRTAYFRVRIANEFDSFKSGVEAAARSCANKLVIDSIRRLYIKTLERLDAERRKLPWPSAKVDLENITVSTMQGMALEQISNDSELLKAAWVSTASTDGLPNLLTPFHQIVHAVCRLVSNKELSVADLWRSVYLLLAIILSEGDADLLQPAPVATSLICVISLPLRILSGYHHLRIEAGYAIAADSISRYLRKFLPLPLRAEVNRVGSARRVYSDACTLLEIPLGPASVTPLAKTSSRELPLWPGVELPVHPALIDETGIVPNTYIAQVLDANYLSPEVVSAWTRIAISLILDMPPVVPKAWRPDDLEGFERHSKAIIDSIMRQAPIWSAGSNGHDASLGLGGPPRVWHFEPTMAATDTTLGNRNELLRKQGNEVWMSAACQPVFDVSPDLGKILKADCGQHHSVLLVEEGQLIGFGSSRNGELGFYHTSFSRELFPALLIKADTGDRRVLDDDQRLRKKERLRVIRTLLRDYLGHSSAIEVNATKVAERDLFLPWALHTPVLITLSCSGRPTKITNVCCGAGFTLCVGMSGRCLLLLCKNSDVDDAVPEECSGQSPNAASRLKRHSCNINNTPSRDTAGFFKSLKSKTFGVRRLESSPSRAAPSAAPPLSAVHPVVVTSNVVAISAGVSHWAAVCEEGFLLVAGENCVDQLGGWLPRALAEQDFTLFNVWRTDCYVSAPGGSAPLAEELTRLVQSPGPPSNRTSRGGYGMAIYALDRVWIILSRPYHSPATEEALGSPVSARHAQEAGLGCLRNFARAHFTSVSCGESHTVALAEVDGHQKFGFTWGNDDLSQQLPLAEFIYATHAKPGACPGLIAVDISYTEAVAGSTVTALGNKFSGQWYGSQVCSHLGWSSAEQVVVGQVSNMNLLPSRLGLLGGRLDGSQCFLLGPDHLGSLVLPRVFEESVPRVWRNRLRSITQSKEALPIPYKVMAMALGTSHALCIVKLGTWQQRSAEAFNNYVFTLSPDLSRQYYDLEDVIKRFLPSGRERRSRKGPPLEEAQPDNILTAVPLRPQSPPTTSTAEESSKWLKMGMEGLQKGIEGASRVMDLLMENIVQSTDLPPPPPLMTTPRQTTTAASDAGLRVNYFSGPADTTSQRKQPPLRSALWSTPQNGSPYSCSGSAAGYSQSGRSYPTSRGSGISPYSAGCYAASYIAPTWPVIFPPVQQQRQSPVDWASYTKEKASPTQPDLSELASRAARRRRD